MQLSEIQNKAEAFFEWPTEDRRHVTTTSALLFAKHCVEEIESEYTTKIQTLINRAGEK